MQVVQNLTGCCETWLARLDVEEPGWVEMSLKLCTGCGVTGWTCTGKYPRVGLTGESLCRSLARLQCPYRVLFRRNISLIKGCVKLTRPFLDMLVTRSLWSKMCKSMLSAGFFFFSAQAKLAGWAMPFNDTQLGRDVEEHCRRSEDPRPAVIGSPGTKKHPTDAVWIQPMRTPVYSNKRARPTDATPPHLKGTAPFKCLARAADGKVMRAVISGFVGNLFVGTFHNKVSTLLSNWDASSLNSSFIFSLLSIF